MSEPFADLRECFDRQDPPPTATKRLRNLLISWKTH
jgi:hypothetical protein